MDDRLMFYLKGSPAEQAQTLLHYHISRSQMNSIHHGRLFPAFLKMEQRSLVKLNRNFIEFLAADITL